MVTKNRKDTLGIEAIIETQLQEIKDREKDYLQKQFESYKEFKYRFKNIDLELKKLKKVEGEQDIHIKKLNKEILITIDIGKLNQVGLTKMKTDLNEFENVMLKKSVFRLAKNRLDLLENNFESQIHQVRKELEKNRYLCLQLCSM